MPARYPGVAEVLSRTLAPLAGRFSALAPKLKVTPPTVSRWAAGLSAPEPAAWPLVESVLDLDSGSLAAAEAAWRRRSARDGGRRSVEAADHIGVTEGQGVAVIPPVVAELRDRVELLEEAASLLLRVAATGGVELPPALLAFAQRSSSAT